MQKLALRILGRFSRKTFIRSAWKNLNSLSEHDELSEALDTLISMSHEENEFIELITVIVDVLSEAPMASAFLCHIIDSAALPSKETSHKITTRLLQKLKPGLCIYRTKSKRRTRINAAIIWSVLAEKLAGEISLSLFSDNVCTTLLDYLQYGTDPNVRLFALIALEKFGITGQNKEKIMSSGRDIHKILLSLAKELQINENPSDNYTRRRQLKFCVEWALKNTFDSGKKDSHDLEENSINPNINVMLNPMDATAHWKISPHGLEIRNDYSSFESIRATMGVSSGKWFYEAILLTNGIMQIGYATKRCMFGPDEGTGVGDDQYGFAFDGCRNVLWANGVSVPYGGNESWKPGDVVGVYMDIGLCCVRFYLNGKDLGIAYPLNLAQFRRLAENGLHPALSFTSYQQATINFGAEKFRHPPPSTFNYQTLNSRGQLSLELRDSIQKREWRMSRYRPISVGSCWKQQLEDTDEDFDAQCSICFAMPPVITLGPCNHDGFCADCAKMMHSCPLCRTPISFRKPMNNNTCFPSTPTKLSISSTSASSSLSSPSTAIVLPPTPPLSRPASSITSWDPDILRSSEP